MSMLAIGLFYGSCITKPIALHCLANSILKQTTLKLSLEDRDKLISRPLRDLAFFTARFHNLSHVAITFFLFISCGICKYYIVDKEVSCCDNKHSEMRNELDMLDKYKV